MDRPRAPRYARPMAPTRREISRRLRSWARELKEETGALYFALRDAETPWHAKVLGFLIIGYALSPLDLIPDFIPVLGYLDDIILLPLGLALFRRLVPAGVLERSRQRAREEFGSGRPRSRVAGAVVVLVWILCLALLLGALAKPLGMGRTR